MDLPIENGGSSHSFLYVYQAGSPRFWMPPLRLRQAPQNAGFGGIQWPVRCQFRGCLKIWNPGEFHSLSWFIMVLSWFTMSFPIKMLISGATNSLWGSLTVHFFQHSSAFFMGVFGNGVYIIRYTVYHQNDQNANSKRENTFTSYRNGFLLLKMTPPWHT